MSKHYFYTNLFGAHQAHTYINIYIYLCDPDSAILSFVLLHLCVATDRENEKKKKKKKNEKTRRRKKKE
jgi:hypothetical protein